jgi:endonuclease YncB( thermonuclease family)
MKKSALFIAIALLLASCDKPCHRIHDTETKKECIRHGDSIRIVGNYLGPGVYRLVDGDTLTVYYSEPDSIDYDLYYSDSPESEPQFRLPLNKTP